MIKVAIISRSTLFEVKGGDTTQILKTAEELRKLGVMVDIFLANEKIEYEKYDMLHFFNLIRPSDHLLHIRKSKKPYVVSPIYLSYHNYDNFGRVGLSKFVFKMMGKHSSEYLKNIFRFAKKQDYLVSPEYLLGHQRAMKKVAQGAAYILSNSNSEFQRLKADLELDMKYHYVPNGIDISVFGELPNIKRIPNKILSVAQIYGMKNQHRLIEVCNQMNVELTIIGKTPPNHKGYLDFCKGIAKPNIHFLDFMTQKELISEYASSWVHALPSWFETTGLSSLEAGSMGCNLVVGQGGDTFEYFDGKAEFCDASNSESIKIALEKSLAKPIDLSFRDYILTHYNWKNAAEETLKVYEKMMTHG